VSTALGGAGGSGDVDQVSEFFDEFSERAPEEIRDDFRVLADAYAAYAEVIADLQLEPGETPDAEGLQRMQEAAFHDRPGGGRCGVAADHRLDDGELLIHPSRGSGGPPDPRWSLR
jgi:hypothetical protein